jgi:hypothetical protein
VAFTCTVHLIYKKDWIGFSKLIVNNAKERSTTAIVTVPKGEVTSNQIEEEFTRIFSRHEDGPLRG